MMGGGTRWVDLTLNAQLTAIASYEEERASRDSEG